MPTQQVLAPTHPLIQITFCVTLRRKEIKYQEIEEEWDPRGKGGAIIGG